MLFGKKKKQAPAKGANKASSQEPGSESGETSGDEPIVPADRALDLMAEMLRITGENSFSLPSRDRDQIEETFEGWARHLLIGTPAPSHEAATGETADPDAEPVAGKRRDLPGLRRAFHEHRESEVEYVGTALGSFRDAAWAFVSGLRRSLSVEQASDRQIGHRMRRLEGAVRTGEPDKIRSEAQETVQLLAEFLAERGTRHQAQITEMAARLEGLRDELDNVRAQAAIDPVTQIYNRSAFDEQIEREIDLATLFQKRGCLVMVDIDHFKWVNDNHGHPCGDHVLREVAECLTRCFMRRDDFVARYGGEEFVIVLRDIELPVARDVAERGMNALRNLEITYEGVEEPIRITASMGIARLRAAEPAASWIERADRALYEAKNGGRDRIEVDAEDLQNA